MKKYLTLFLTMLKIGAFTFGGGYAMIALLQNEFTEKKKWLDEEEFSNLVAIAESTPGPLAINSATYIGYRVGGIGGSALATLGICLPSFCVIYVISLFFNEFLSFEYVARAFRGIRVAVTFLILAAGVRMFKKLPKNAFNCVVFALTVVAMIACSLFAVGFSSVFYILISAALGLFLYLVGRVRAGKEEKEK